MVQKLFSPSSQDLFRVVVVNIDNQNDFVKKNGRLSVPGAVEAANRAAYFILDNTRKLTTIMSSFDKHRSDGRHIFYSIWWLDASGNHPKDFTEITYTDVLKGVWTPLFDIEWSLSYVKTLGSFTIWPIHCTQGDPGSDMVLSLSQAIANHSYQRNTKMVWIEKGQNPRTEHYGIFGAEVEDPDDPSTKLDTQRLREISEFDLSYWFGQEKNHCVRRSLEQYIDWCTKNNPDAIYKMRYMADCTSLLPLGPEYTKDAEDSVNSMVLKGMTIVNSTDPIS
ncbi:MAG TPA: hypothetical protein VLH94_01825 [Spirochaetia bacterium]|nr:hypothetical protein [Spirochaetia bacterium]